MDIVSDTYIHGGIPQSRYCSNCAHYQTLSGSSIDSNCGGSGARASAAAPSCGRSTAIAAPENGGQHHDD